MHAVSRFISSAALGLSSLAFSAANQVDEHAGPERSSATTAPAVFTGRVFLPDGEPAVGAVVVTSAGGEAVTAADGSFELEVEMPLDAESVRVTAVASGGAQTLVASSRVEVLAPGRATPVERLLLASGTSCQPSWIPTFGGTLGMDDIVEAMAVFDDGSGPALYVGGHFTHAGGVAAKNIAKWDGTSWSALGTGVSSFVLALTVFDDGSGPALYAGGDFGTAGGVHANRIAKWDGTSWSALGSGLNGEVVALTEFDDGNGPALYAGGTFTTAGGAAANRIAKWNGTIWSALGSGLASSIESLAVFDDGSGSALYAGGTFTLAGGVAANRIAKWNGTIWSALESGMNDTVHALATFDDGGGSALYAGGEFTLSSAGDNYAAKWGSCPPITHLPGCAGNPATLEALAASAPLGVPLPLRITSSAAVSGLGVVVYGATGIDGSGCGIFVPGFGELLLALAPAPKTLPAGVLAGGVCDLSPLVPSIPSLSGVVAYLQAAAVDLALPQPIEVTNALAVKLGP